MSLIQILNRYIILHLFQATVVVSVILIGIVFLTQSIRFLELVVETGASAKAFWFLTVLALPRFFEIIVPIAVMIAILFVYHRLLADSELVVMKSAGLSSLQLARPAFYFIGAVIVFLYIMSLYAGPKSAAAMQHYRQVIKANATQLFFREGVFNTISDGVMIYIRNKTHDGTLQGLLIHDRRQKETPPITVIADRGVIITDETGQKQVVVYDGQRQQYNPDTSILDKLSFERYTLEIPQEDREVRERWAEPEERTFAELVFPENPEDPNYLRMRANFIAEANRRLSGPLLTLSFGTVSLAFLLLGPVSRGGYTRRIVLAALTGILLQSLYLVCFDMAKSRFIGNVFLYILVLGPALFTLVLLRYYNRLMLAGGKSSEIPDKTTSKDTTGYKPEDRPGDRE